ncbi:hypothetical protein MNBD_ALPHA09-481 [hydrothermal vent metagenome]|uniref:DUF1835 domain-containing protein n=1 Tax=hydrothermal vent metagenome TaxID=652676 RepID=A0A3B0TFR4_9ZZZZ
MATLIITNGDIAAGTLATARPEATILPWRDVLHDGPVRELSAEEFRAERAAFLADGVVNTVQSVTAELTERDALVAGHHGFDRIELWFEHDLYDQLQIVQVVDMLVAAGRRQDLYHIPSPRHLGPIPPDRIGELEKLTLPVNAAMFSTASAVWSAYRQPALNALDAVRKEPIAGFPFLGHAIHRALQDLPDANGLTRTERQMLYSIDRGLTLPGVLFARVLNMEEAAFLGDWGFYSRLSNLAFAAVPLITGLTERFEPAVMHDDKRRKAYVTTPLALTTYGAEVLAGNEDRAARNVIDFWLGGTRVTNDNLWRWNDKTETLVAPRK